MNKINEAHGLDRAPTATEQKFNATRGRWLAVFPDGRRLVAREHDAETLATPGLRWYAVADYADEYETIGWPIVPPIDVVAIEARANEQPVMLVVTSNPESTGSLASQTWIINDRGSPLTAPIERSLAHFIVAARTDVPALTAALCDAYSLLNLYADRATQRIAEYTSRAREMDECCLALRAATQEAHTARRQTSALADAVRRERDARAAWLASLPDGSCGNPPPQALLYAEEATGEALRAIEVAK